MGKLLRNFVHFVQNLIHLLFTKAGFSIIYMQNANATATFRNTYVTARQQISR